MKSVLLYLIVYAVSSFFIAKSKFNGKNRIDLYFILSIFIPVIFAAKRNNVGSDFPTYMLIYGHNSILTFQKWFATNSFVSGIGFSVWLFAKIAGYFNSSELFFGLFAFAVVIPVAYRLKTNYTYKICSLAYFVFLMTLYTSGLNICKQMAAIGILFCGIKYINERKFLKYVFVVVVSSLIHPTASIAIFAYFLYDNNGKLLTLKKMILIIAGIVAVVMYQKVLQIVGGKFESYSTYKDETNNRLFFLNLAWCLIFCFWNRNYIKFDERNNTLITMLIIGLILEFTGFSSPFVKRIAMYYSYPQFLLISQLPYTIVTRKSVPFAKIMIVVYTILLFIVQYLILGQASIIPYSF